MRAIRFHETGGPEVLRVEQVPDPEPKPGAVLVRVRAIGVNFADTHFRKGDYFVKPKLPDVPGMECAGEVIAVGEGVTGFAPGDRVMALGAAAYAEKMLAVAPYVYPMPADLSFEDAAALPVQGLTAMHVLYMCARTQPGEAVLVHAAAGGVGSLAVQIAKRRGAGVVIGTASSDEKRRLVRELGADEAIAADAELPARVKEITQGKGVDVVLEMIGGAETYKRNLACLRTFGRMVVYGAASGDLRATIEPVGLMGKNLSVIGYYLTPLLGERARSERELTELAAMVARGEVKVVRGASFPLDRAADAHRALESRATTGKVVLVP